MHADLPAAPRRAPGLGRDLALALGVHVLLVLVFVLAWWWSPERSMEAATGDPLEASLEVSASEARAARQALAASERLDDLPEPLPEPAPAAVPEPAPEDTVPPPQPEPEPRPDDARSPMQHNAQQQIAQPDTVDQERVSALAIAEEKARQEQEAKRRQEQIDLTERKRVEEAEQRRRLAAQQEADRQKKLAEERKQAADAAERAERLAQIRREREQAQRQAQAAEARLREMARARAESASNAAAAATPRAGAGGTSEDLTARYAAAIQQAVLNQWIRPDTIPVGQKCRLTIRQLPGGEVVEVSFTSGCPYDEAGRRSVEAAILRAQPLPYRGYESVFQRTLNFNFEARDR